VQHALRAFTPRDQRAVKAAAETFRANPKLDVSEVITQLGVGEALVSTLEGKGAPGIVERTLIRPPSSRMGPATLDERQRVMSASPVAARYDQSVDRESAHEVLKKKADEKLAQHEEEQRRATLERAAAEEAKRRERLESQERRVSGRRQTTVEAMAKSVARSVGSQIGRQIARGILGSLLKR
jgi:hypothetical protein